MIKKPFVLILLLIGLLVITSCNYGSIHRRNYFIKGEFSGINSRNKTETYYFNVREISKEDYEIAEGINVVFDV